jgi:hypothetical protein
MTIMKLNVYSVFLAAVVRDTSQVTSCVSSEEEEVTVCMEVSNSEDPASHSAGSITQVGFEEEAVPVIVKGVW